MRKAVFLVLAIMLVGFVSPAQMWAAGTSSFKVNDYIIDNGLESAKVEYQHKSIFPKFNYRYGYGEVEGIVAHETANDKSTINGEISYMLRNYRRAFVHAFVDDRHVIEIHSPSYGAWGAGSVANQRFVHVELVRVKKSEEAKFAKSINNYATYIASILYRYNLPLIDAEMTGSGTLWSHNAVRKFLGGTTHEDPHQYFSSRGYSWGQFVQLVKAKYQQLPAKTANTNRLGQIRSSSVKILQNYLDSQSAVAAGAGHTGKTYFIKKAAFTQGQIYYQLSEQPSSTNGMVGWVKAEDVISYPNRVVDQKEKILYFTGKGSAYSNAWGAKKDVIYGSLSSYKDRQFKINRTETVGSDLWYYGSLDGKKFWVKSTNLAAKVERATSRLAKVRNSGVTIFKTIGNPGGAIQAGSAYTGSVYYIKRQAVLGSSTYYLLSNQPSSVKGIIGWVKSSDLISYSHTSVDHKAKTMFFNGEGSAYNKQWGGTKDVVYNSLSQYKNKEFKIGLTEKVGNNTWYRGNLAGKTVWIQSSYLQKTLESTTSRLGNIKKSSVRIYKKLGHSSSFRAGTSYTNKVFYIKKQGKFNGQNYYLLSKNADGTSVIGWVKATELTSLRYSVESYHKYNNKTLYLSGKGSAYSKPWGGNKDVVYKKLSAYKKRKFIIRQTVKVGNTKWYQGVIKEKTVWLKG